MIRLDSFVVVTFFSSDVSWPTDVYIDLPDVLIPLFEYGCNWSMNFTAAEASKWV